MILKSSCYIYKDVGYIIVGPREELNKTYPEGGRSTIFLIWIQ